MTNPWGLRSVSREHELSATQREGDGERSGASLGPLWRRDTVGTEVGPGALLPPGGCTRQNTIKVCELTRFFSPLCLTILVLKLNSMAHNLSEPHFLLLIMKTDPHEII